MLFLQYSLLPAVCLTVALAHNGRSFLTSERLPFYDVYRRVSRTFGNLPDWLRYIPSTDHTKLSRVHSYLSEQAEPVRRSLSAALLSARKERVDAELGSDTVCPFSIGGYHVVLSEHFIAPEIGALECAKHGWQYAIVPDADWELASWTISNCTFLSVGLRSFNGYEAGMGCQIMQDSGVFMISLNSLECASALGFPLLCREGPLEQFTETLTGDFATYTTIQVTPTPTPSETIETTLTPAMKRARETVGPRAPIDKKIVAARRKKQFGDIINGYDVCFYSYASLHIVYDAFLYQDAEQVCSDLGWHVADITIDNMEYAMSTFNDCAPLDLLFNIHSFANFAYGECRMAYFLPWFSIWGLSVVNPNVCSFMYAPVICQDYENYNTATGGTVVETTVLNTSTVVLPFSTVTVTETVSA